MFSCHMYRLFLLQHVFPLFFSLLNFVCYLPVICKMRTLTLILLTWRIWWAPNNASKWQMGFNLAFEGLMWVGVVTNACYFYHILWRIKIVHQNIPVLNSIYVLFVVRNLLYSFKLPDGQKKRLYCTLCMDWRRLKVRIKLKLPLQVIKACRAIGPIILHLCDIWSRVFSFSLLPLYPQRRTPGTYKLNMIVEEWNCRKLLKMDILKSETCWAHNKWKKIASDIKLVFHSSTITMMQGPINIKLNMRLDGPPEYVWALR
jgi:hypothetical protein